MLDAFHQSRRGIMESALEVAGYTATLTRELCRMCRQVELDDLAYLLEVAAAEAAKVESTNLPARASVRYLHVVGE
jgi:hypothetical protein